ncbi:hypothetical protein AOQ84DRAFT_352996 [Glonium stellatum]|uniref:Transcription factor TFIIIC triple barrel domain-containing protein n=1 Tax=Glonium stellatum TaxID=574774 RepID=A0A8E2JVS8_9PEZI|nr:hypothetical protein AOQ84DRAFT_352996 [Glonium stellatum]
MDDPEEDEWEYEYDENETEHFYITLDLSNATPASKPRKVDMPSLTPAATDAATQTRHSTGDLHSGGDDSADAPSHSNPDLARSNGMDAIQILDLHTRNPLIHYQGQLLSCHWASTIGSDLLFANAPQDRVSYPEPLRALPSFDLLGISSTKLIATTTQLRPRYSSPSTDEKRDGSGPAQAITVDDDTLEDDTVNIPSAHDAPKAQKNQANFLSRLNAAKARRGEKDRAPAGAFKKSIVLDETDEDNVQSSGGGAAVGIQQNTPATYEIPARSQVRQDDGIYTRPRANGDENRGTYSSTDNNASIDHGDGVFTLPSAPAHQVEAEMEIGEPPNGHTHSVYDGRAPVVQSHSAEDGDVLMRESNGQPSG